IRAKQLRMLCVSIVNLAPFDRNFTPGCRSVWKISGIRMKRHLAFGWLWFVAVPVQACTIFVLTDTNRVLFCNNEDWGTPMTVSGLFLRARAVWLRVCPFSMTYLGLWCAQ